MTSDPLGSDAWRQVNDLFHRALEVPAPERSAFVAHEAAHDAAIRDEVLSLLAAHEQTAQFLAQPVAGQAIRAPSSAEAPGRRVGQQIGQYRIDRILGIGGMGVVYQAEDLRLRRTVALKAISADLTRLSTSRDRLVREARAAAALTHPGIATVYALEEFGDDVFIAGEYVAGETLREEIARGAVAADRVLDTAIELTQALAAAHDRGVIHRDLKPENVMRAPSGRFKILDFGLARVRDIAPDVARLTDDGTLLGTPAYMSPEQIRREPVDGRSDLFSLGIVLYELITGAHPFGSADSAATIARILESDPPPFNGGSGGSAGSEPGGRLTHGVHSIIRTLLRKTPAGRFASAHELLAALERVRAGRVSVPPDAGGAPAHARWWWKFHQGMTSSFYLLLMIPVWLARDELGSPYGLPLMLLAIVAVVTATTLRMHLWFAADSLPGEWAHQYARSWTWLRAADTLLAVTLVVTGLVVLERQPPIAVALVAGGVLALLSATIIEPATTRAAFGNGRAD